MSRGAVGHASWWRLCVRGAAVRAFILGPPVPLPGVACTLSCAPPFPPFLGWSLAGGCWAQSCRGTAVAQAPRVSVPKLSQQIATNWGPSNNRNSFAYTQEARSSESGCEQGCATPGGSRSGSFLPLPALGGLGPPGLASESPPSLSRSSDSLPSASLPLTRTRVKGSGPHQII